MSRYKLINGYTKEQVLSTLRSMKGQAIDKSIGACEYLTDEGRRCAVGMFIDPQYWKDEGSVYTGGVDCLLIDHPELAQQMPLGIEAMTSLQIRHDQYIDPDCPKIGNYLANWLEEKMKAEGV